MTETSPKQTGPSFLQALLIVFRVFTAIGHQGPSLAEQGIKPLHLVVAGILAAVILVSFLLFVVQLVLRLSH